MSIRQLWVGLVIASLATHGARAEVTIFDKNEWKIGLGGFIETDAIVDSTRSLTEVPGNSPVDRVGSINAQNGRTQFSVRNSRLSLSVAPPVQDGWASRGYFEFDLLGYDPAPGTTVTNSEAGFFNNATVRVRHAFLTAENSGWQVLAGQTWSLLGWQPDFVPPSTSVAPVAGVLYERTARVGLQKSAEVAESNLLKAALSVERPAQRDSSVPTWGAGLQWNDSELRSGWGTASGDVKARPLTLAASGIYRHYSVPVSSGVTDQTTTTSAAVFAADAYIPLVPSSDSKVTSGTLSFCGEFTTGTGDGDQFTNWTGNTNQLFSGSSTTPSFVGSTDSSLYNPNLDAGIGAFDLTSGLFRTIDLRSWSAQLQWQLPTLLPTYLTASYSRLFSDNILGLTPIAASTSPSTTYKVLYDKSETVFLSLFHDLTKQIRVGAEGSFFRTHYADGNYVHDHREMLAMYFRF